MISVNASVVSEPAVNLTGKRIVVTGGSRGIGAAVVEACLGAGATVVSCSRTPPRHVRPGVLSILADVSTPADVSRLFEAAQRELGGVDAVIHAAAVLEPIGNVCDVDVSEWLQTLTVDLYGTFLVTREACIRMSDSGGGRIVLLSGGGASGPFPNYSAYACSKVAVVRLAETVAEEMRDHGIEINCLAPGFVATAMHESTLRAGPAASGRAYYERTKEELAKGGTPPALAGELAAFLVSDAAAGITGKLISALHDGVRRWPSHVRELRDTDIFTLRRILPNDRGMEWQ